MLQGALNKALCIKENSLKVKPKLQFGADWHPNGISEFHYEMSKTAVVQAVVYSRPVLHPSQVILSERIHLLKLQLVL